MKSLNDLRDDIRGLDTRFTAEFRKLDGKLTDVDDRLGTVEGRISRLIWVVTGAGLVLAGIFGGLELLTSYFDVTITPKE